MGLIIWELTVGFKNFKVKIPTPPIIDNYFPWRYLRVFYFNYLQNKTKKVEWASSTGYKMKVLSQTLRRLFSNESWSFSCSYDAKSHFPTINFTVNTNTNNQTSMILVETP